MDIIKEKNDTYYQDEKKMNLNILASKTNSNHGFSYKGYEKILRAKKEYLPSIFIIKHPKLRKMHFVLGKASIC